MKKYPTSYVIDLQNALDRSADNFRCQLFMLILKADNINKAKLKQVYPLEFEVYETWYEFGDDFFKKQLEMKEVE